jgi:hypothetical protein
MKNQYTPTMWKLVKFISSKQFGISTIKGFGIMTEPGSPEETVKGGFLTREEADEYRVRYLSTNPSPEYSFEIKPQDN